MVEFIDFSIEPGYDYLYIGTAQSDRTLTYDGNSPTALDVVSPADGSPLYFEFYTDGSVTYPGFHLCLTNINSTGKFRDDSVLNHTLKTGKWNKYYRTFTD